MRAILSFVVVVLLLVQCAFRPVLVGNMIESEFYDRLTSRIRLLEDGCALFGALSGIDQKLLRKQLFIIPSQPDGIGTQTIVIGKGTEERLRRVRITLDVGNFGALTPDMFVLIAAGVVNLDDMEKNAGPRIKRVKFF